MMHAWHGCVDGGSLGGRSVKQQGQLGLGWVFEASWSYLISREQVGQRGRYSCCMVLSLFGLQLSRHMTRAVARRVSFWFLL